MRLRKFLVRFKIKVNDIAIFRNLLSKGLFFIEDQYLGKWTGRTWLDQIGDLMSHTNERFTQPPDDTFDTTIKVNRNFGIAYEEDFHRDIKRVRLGFTLIKKLSISYGLRNLL